MRSRLCPRPVVAPRRAEVGAAARVLAEVRWRPHAPRLTAALERPDPPPRAVVPRAERRAALATGVQEGEIGRDESQRLSVALTTFGRRLDCELTSQIGNRREVLTPADKEHHIDKWVSSM